ncbi:tRNA (uridine(34)/cytosine(34)/5-carboxymethylaminomethyluridine(34)-2'-O)-methyltransferase TrmL [Peribacillus frigoritolerans]|uniref:tRNA (uridine(34)/cytosine(34)/5- carboxymethylaminomethyluridine(34)-2'-O)- methyltransferase TrmL n=1 Tax=Peribacillus TaxID=2675229 RepID=UPI0005528281|nr:MULTISPECIES: tRNA (uridine(34)/cytosine(34)/5-carboxymethylaminomethyluridine(34)-2'-O)-methyltransferase TrmL [Peribacillus]KRF59934.1 tRNA methyltransferase [Bacillus sp. Soil745]MBT2604033.1 tRNA (uridine(34)/cytosine(34)/5-carboxymethylaminomethyluridine(34)-2'-O)-methyltransferase TrmL [Bacillus sp. ISL-53]MDP9742721.1 tRNA (cytidine/uridine-2'-O-)-methyltransferase [Bacillus sp. B2I3]PAW31090.1 tRNA (cytidine(34)-2'-O)-methyltransferase [Peribacillus simplex]PEF40941.1 tRNA (uridine(
MSIHVVLYQPQIPANTGNIARTCAGTDTSLHLIRPLGFSTDDKQLKRAGLDYWENVKIHYYDSLEEFFERNAGGEFYYLTKFGEQPHSSFDYSDQESEIFFIFGRETTGLPKDLIQENMDRCLRIPMTDKVRSLNLSNTAAILVYEALRQQNYRELDLKTKG